jgi:hypothetical protein
MPGVGLDLPAQVLDVGIDGALEALVVVALDVVDQLEAGVDPARVAGQGDQ